MNASSNPARTPALRWLSLLVLLLALNWVQSACAQSYVLSNLCSVAPSTNTFTNTFILANDGGNNFTRGLAYNPVTGHLLVASRTPVPNYGTNFYGTNAIYILNATNGAVLGQLPYDTNVINSGRFMVNMVAVDTNGVVYVGNLVTASTDGPFRLYRWANESSSPTLAYSGDPSGGFLFGTSPQRYGDSIALRGTGANTQILLGTANQTLALLTTTDGVNFNATRFITSTMANGDSYKGLVWGPGNTCYVKQSTGHLRLLNLDPSLGIATVITNIALPTNTSLTMPVVAGNGGPIAVDLSQNLMAVVDTTIHKVLLYDISDSSNPIQQDTARSFAAANANANAVGSVALLNGLLFALEPNNGIVGYSLNPTTLPAKMVAQPASIYVCQGATYTITAQYGGTRPFTYQWRLGGTNIPGATTASLTLSNLTFGQAGSYSVAVSNSLGGAVSANATISVTPNNSSTILTKLWEIKPGGPTPYLTYRPAGDSLIGYKEYGVAINPVNTNIIVVTRLDPTNMIAVMDINGNFLHYINYSPLASAIGTSGQTMNKLAVAADGTVYVCNYGSGTAFKIFAFSDDSANPASAWVAFSGDPANGATGGTNSWGYTIQTQGSGPNTQVLVGSANSALRNFAILTNDVNGVLHSTFYACDTSVPLGFCRLGLDWGPSPNTVWGKTSGGNLCWVQYDPASGTASLLASFPINTSATYLRNTFSTMCDIKYDPTTGLLAGLLNAQTGGSTAPAPVSVLLFDANDTGSGPFLVDQQFEASYNGDIESQGTVSMANGYVATLGENAGVMLFRVNSAAVSPGNIASIPRIVTPPSPASATTFIGLNYTYSVLADDTTGNMSYQWYLNGQSVSGATSSSYTISNAQTNQAGMYSVVVSNMNGGRTSAPVALSVVAPYTTSMMKNVWSLTPGSRPYVTYVSSGEYGQYGLAFNPATSNLLIASMAGGPYVAVVNAQTGTDVTNLDVSAVTYSSGSAWQLHKIGVADDGVVYAAGAVSTPAANFAVYRWPNDSGTNVATVAFQGDPLSKSNPNNWAGITMAVRGAGTNTQILLSSYSNVVAVLTTTDSSNFVANSVSVAADPYKFARLGICWGAGNTFWTKAYYGDVSGGLLTEVQYNLAAGTGTNLYSNASGLPTTSSVTTIAYDDTLKMLAGIGTDSASDSVQVFDMSNLSAGPRLLDQVLFPTTNPSVEQNGAITFGMSHTWLFALAENNGIMAFQINPLYGGFKIIGVTPAAGSVTLTWQAVSGSNYQVQRASSVNGGWTDLGAIVTATGSTASYTDTVPDPNVRFYRVVAK
jgi:hypothetical protein